MLKIGLRFPLSSLHRQLLWYLGLAVNQISPNAWKVFLNVRVLYRAMFDRAQRLTVKEFFHCYRPDEIAQSKGMYSFVLRSSSLRLVCETLDSNKNWKSQYFFMENDEWMCRPSDTDYMPIDKTWGILPPSGMNPSMFSILVINCYVTNHLLLQFGSVHKFL